MPGVVDPLLELLAACVVRIDRDGRFEGSGFLVAPGEVLTCAHVAHGGLPLTVHTSDGATYPAEPITALLAPDDERARFYPEPDAVVLRVRGLTAGHPCVRLEDARPAVGDVLQLTSFTEGEYAPGRVVRTGATLHMESLFEQDGCTLYKLREGQVLGGFSGGALLNRRTGGVCALVDSSRSTTSDLGGFGVPVTAILAEIDAGLLARNAAVHASDRRWDVAVEAQRMIEADRSGARDALPLLPPVVELDWDSDESPSELLRARHAVVPFVRRGDLLEQVMRWREREDRLSVMVLTGAGGFGKTRTAAEICLAAAAAGWTAGLLDAEPDALEGLDDLVTWPGRTVVAVDYAETRPAVVTHLLKRLLSRRGGGRCRVMLIVRQGGGRDGLIEQFATGDARDDLARLLRRAELVGLGRGERELDRRALFCAGNSRFAALLNGPVAGVPDLRAEHFERPLFVLAAALLAAASPELDVSALTAEQLLTGVLDRHEAAYWERTDQRLGLGLDRSDRRATVALAVLGGLRSDEDDQQLMRLVPALRDASAERLMAIVRWLRALYGPHGSLEPDLLAEFLVIRIAAETPGLVDAVLGTVSDVQLARALVVLSRAAARSDHLREMVRDALDERLPDLVERVGAGGTDLTVALHLAVAATKPMFGAVNAQYRMQIRSSAAGLLALDLGDLAVDALRRAVAKDQPTYQSALAAALTMRASTLSMIGRPNEGLEPIAEAVRIYGELAAADPTRFLPDLATALNNQSEILLANRAPQRRLGAHR